MSLSGNIPVYNPKALSIYTINKLIERGERFDIIPDLDEEEYCEIEEVNNGSDSKAAIHT